jgi:hypothetical protein
MAAPKPTPRKPTAFSPSEHEMLSNAAYWEGYKTVRKFVVEIMRRYIEDREKARGERYSTPPVPLTDDDES